MNPREFGQATVPPRRPNPLVVAWRWRYEAALVAGIAAAAARGATTIGPLWTVTVGIALVGIGTSLPPLREFLVRRAWCVITAHRVRTACKHLWLQSRTGRLPFVLWTRSVPGGELCVLWCRPGIAAEDIVVVRDQIAAACWARDVQVAADKDRTQLVYLTVLRAAQDEAAYAPGPL